jgi:hypothetical protein
MGQNLTGKHLKKKPLVSAVANNILEVGTARATPNLSILSVERYLEVIGKANGRQS